MRVALELLLFVAGFAIGLWWTTFLVLPLLYGVPRALVGYARKTLYFKAALMFLIAPLLWTLFFVAVFLGLAVWWNSAFEYLRESPGFNIGQGLGTVSLLLNALFSRKAHIGMRNEFDELVSPYARGAR